MKEYIDLNTKMRKGATNAFEKDFYKLTNNAVFGKSMENMQKWIDMRLCSDAKEVEELVAKPHFKDRTIFSENLVLWSKLHNQIVELLNLLMKEGVVTSDDAKEYYSYIALLKMCNYIPHNVYLSEGQIDRMKTAKKGESVSL